MLHLKSIYPCLGQCKIHLHMAGDQFHEKLSLETVHPQIHIVYHLGIRFAKNTRLLNVTFSHYWVHSVRWQIEIKKLCLPFYLRKEGDGKFNLQLFTVILLACDANPKWEKLVFYISCRCFFFLLHDMFESSKTRKQTLCLFDGSKVPKPFWHLTKNKKMWCLWWMSQK